MKGVTDVVKIEKLLRMAMQLDGVLNNVVFDLNQEFKNGGILKQEIKQNLNKIREKLRHNIKGDWNQLEKDSEFFDNFCENAIRFETICYNFFRLGESMNVNIEVKYPVGSKVWTMNNGKATLCEVKNIEIQMAVNDNSGNLIDNSYYTLCVLDKNQKRTKYVINRGEEDIYKHLKDLRNENTKKQNNGE